MSTETQTVADTAQRQKMGEDRTMFETLSVVVAGMW